MLACSLPPSAAKTASLHNVCTLFHSEGKGQGLLSLQSMSSVQDLEKFSCLLPASSPRPGDPDPPHTTQLGVVLIVLWVSLLFVSLGQRSSPLLWITFSCPHTPVLGHPSLRCNLRRPANTERRHAGDCHAGLGGRCGCAPLSATRAQLVKNHGASLGAP